VLDDTLDAAGLLLSSTLCLALVAGFLVFVPLTCVMLAIVVSRYIYGSGDLP
jgi:hypothetical protein